MGYMKHDPQYKEYICLLFTYYILVTVYSYWSLFLGYLSAGEPRVVLCLSNEPGSEGRGGGSESSRSPDEFPSGYPEPGYDGQSECETNPDSNDQYSDWSDLPNSEYSYDAAAYDADWNVECSTCGEDSDNNQESSTNDSDNEEGVSEDNQERSTNDSDNEEGVSEDNEVLSVIVEFLENLNL